MKIPQNFDFKAALADVKANGEPVFTKVTGTVEHAAFAPNSDFGPRFRAEFRPDGFDKGQAPLLGLSMNLSMLTEDRGTDNAHRLGGQPPEIHVGDKLVVFGELTPGMAQNKDGSPGYMAGGLMMHEAHLNKPNSKHNQGGVVDLTTNHKWS